MPKIFISYRRRDSSHVSGRIYDILADQFGRESVLKDIDNIRAGIDFRDEISRLLGECDVVLAIVGPQWMGVDAATNTRRIDEENDPVRVEIDYVISRNIPIIPVLFDGVTMESLKNLPESIATFVYRNGFEIRADPYFRSDMDMVVRRVKTDFPSEADREQQALQERLAQLERERKLSEDRRRLGELEAERQQREEQERLAQQRREEQERLAQQRAEEERKRQEELERQKRTEEAYKAKLDAIKKQRDRVETVLIVSILVLTGALGGYIGDTLWINLIHRGGGNVAAGFLIGVLAIIGLAVGLFVGAALGWAVTGGLITAIISTLGTIAGAIVGARIGASSHPGLPGTLIGLGLGTLIFGTVFGIIGAIARDEHASPWYVGSVDRISIPKEERVKLPEPAKATATPAGNR